MRRAALLVACALLGALPAAAVQPLDDDAGSGGDAGDRLELALPVRPGTFAGRLHLAIDGRDAYAFEGRAGDWVTFGIGGSQFVVAELYGPGAPTASGEALPHAYVLRGDTRTFLLPADGTWYFLVRGTPAFGTTQIRYEVAFGFERPATGVIGATGGAAWTVHEFRWDEPARVLLDARLPVGDTAARTDALTMLAIFHGRLEPGIGEFHLGMAVYGSGAGQQVVAGPVRTSLGVPPGALALRLTEGGGFVGFDPAPVVGPVAGWVRMVLFHTPGERPTATFSANVSVAHASATGTEGLVRWDEAAAESGVQLVAPGASLVGPRDLDLAVDGPVYGLFTPMAHGGEVRHPDGGSRFLNLFDSAFLVAPPDGTWRFHLDDTAGAGPLASSNYLAALRVPPLGLAPDLRDGPHYGRGPDLCDDFGLLCF